MCGCALLRLGYGCYCSYELHSIPLGSILLSLLPGALSATSGRPLQLLRDIIHFALLELASNQCCEYLVTTWHNANDVIGCRDNSASYLPPLPLLNLSKMQIMRLQIRLKNGLVKICPTLRPSETRPVCCAEIPRVQRFHLLSFRIHTYPPRIQLRWITYLLCKILFYRR